MAGGPPPPPPGAPVGHQGPPGQPPNLQPPVIKEETEVIYGDYGPIVVKKERRESDYDPSMPTEADSPGMDMINLSTVCNMYTYF